MAKSFETLTSATFTYKGYQVTARRMVDSASKKFFGWQGDIYSDIYSEENPCVVAMTIQQFERQFKLQVDMMTTECAPAVEENPCVEETSNGQEI